MGKRGPRGEGSLHWVESRGYWRWRDTYKAPWGVVQKTFTAKKQGDVVKRRDAWVEELGQASRRGIRPDTATLAEYLPDWLAHSARASVAENTYERYEQVVRRHLTRLLGGVMLSDVSAADVRYLKQELLDSGLAPATVGYVQGVLSTALNQAVADGLIPSNPSSKVRKSKERGEKMRPLSAEQAARLVEVARGTRYEALYLLAAKVGPRQGEIAALFWEDLDEDTLLIDRSVGTNTKGNRWGKTKTGKGRTVRLPRSVLEALRRHRALQLEERVASRKWGDERLIFPNRYGRVLRRTTLMRDFHTHLEAAALPRIRFHDLRHTAATLMLRQGVPVPAVSQILGHKNPTQTLNRYAHVLSDMQKSAAAKMDALDF